MVASRTPRSEPTPGDPPGEDLEADQEPGECLVEAVRFRWPDPAARLLLAVSGGVDSTALMLLAAARFGPARLAVAHVHHGMQADADQWADQVRDQAAALGLVFHLRRLDGQAAAARRHDGLGPEGWARRERYRVLAELARELKAVAVLTGHQRDDQIETHLLQAARGAGDRGLAAMVPARLLVGGPAGRDGPWLLRPFLSVPRARLADVVRQAGWRAIDDPSNHDRARRRSRLRLARQAVAADIPLARVLSVIAGHRARDDDARQRAESDLALVSLVPETAVPIPARPQRPVREPGQSPVPGGTKPGGQIEDDGARIKRPHGQALRAEPKFIAEDEHRLTAPHLSRTALGALTPERRADLWRYWLASAGLAAPSRRRLDEIDRQMVRAEGPEGRVAHDGWLLIRFQDRIGLLSRLPPAPGSVLLDAARLLPGAGGAAALTLRDDHWGLERLPDGAAGSLHRTVRLPVVLPDKVEVGPGHGGDRWRAVAPDGRQAGPAHALRKLWQEGGVPPWLRPCLPVLRDPATGRLLAAVPFGQIVTPGTGPGPWPAAEHETAPGAGPVTGPVTRPGAGPTLLWLPPLAWLPWLDGVRRQAL